MIVNLIPNNQLHGPYLDTVLMAWLPKLLAGALRLPDLEYHMYMRVYLSEYPCEFVLWCVCKCPN